MLKTLLFSLLTIVSFPSHSSSELVFSTDHTDISINIYSSKGNIILLMLPSEYGFQDSHKQLAKAVSEYGIEVWMVNLFESYFLPIAASSLDKFSEQHIHDLIRFAYKKTGKKIFLMSHDKGSQIALRTIRYWNSKSDNNKNLASGILISPNLYTDTPEAGTKATYLPIVDNYKYNLFLLQPELSPKAWDFTTLINKLRKSGSSVHHQIIANTRDRFFFRDDASKQEDEIAEKLPSLIKKGIHAIKDKNSIEVILKKDSQALNKKKNTKAKTKNNKGLRNHNNSFSPQDFELNDIYDNKHSLKDYREKVIVINFWAGWCPPCVHEMPSMQKLKERFKNKPFTIIAINMAEDKHTVHEFIEKNKFDFTVLLDPDGKTLKKWNVFAFPTSYIIDKKGKIQYSGFGAIDWLDDQVTNKISKLLEAD